MILQDAEANPKLEPFASYDELVESNSRLKIARVAFDDTLTAAKVSDLCGSADFIFDNVSKNPADEPFASFLSYAEAENQRGSLKTYSFVSSAGMYNPKSSDNVPMSEQTETKESGQRLFEKEAVKRGLPLASFRPQYIYGPLANKYDYLDWFFDRILARKPLLIPGDGSQIVSLTNCQDVASLVSSVCNGGDKASGIFNCGTTNVDISYNEVAVLCAAVAGVSDDELKIVNFDFDGKNKGR